MSLLVWLVLKITVGIRVDEATEYEGIDFAECGVQAYPEFGASSLVADAGVPALAASTGAGPVPAAASEATRGAT